jgi:all-trans-retinol 13,14-reductase
MSGLTSAAVLARCGQRVLVLEQHDRCGGGTHMYDLEGYRFDAGLHYTIPWSGPLLSVAAGASAPKVVFEKMGEPDGTFDKIVIGDKPAFHIKHHEAHLTELRKLFPSPEDQRAIDAYMTISEGLLKATPVYILSKFLPVWLQKIIWRLFLGHFARYSGQTALAVLQQITTNKHLISLLCGLWIDTGVCMCV